MNLFEKKCTSVNKSYWYMAGFKPATLLVEIMDHFDFSQYSTFYSLNKKKYNYKQTIKQLIILKVLLILSFTIKLNLINFYIHTYISSFLINF